MLLLLWCCCGAVVGVLQPGSKLKAKTAANTYVFFWDMFCLSGTYMLHVQNMYKILMAIAFPWSPPFLKGPCPFSRVCFLFFSRVIIPFQGSLSFSKDSFLFQGPEPSRELHVKEDQQAVAQLWLCHCQLAFVDMHLPRLSMPFQGCGNVLGKALTQHGFDKAKQGSCCMYCFFCLMSGEVQIE